MSILTSRFRFNTALPWIAFLGVDGSGKSSVLQQLEETFCPPLYAGMKIVHRRPGLIAPVKENKLESGEEVKHYSKSPHHVVISVIKLAIAALDWFLGYWVYVVYYRNKNYLVCFDRHYLLDLLVDPLRYRYGGPTWLTRIVIYLLPKPDLIILLDAPIEVIQSRKQEVSPETAVQQRSAYLKLVSAHPNGYIVDATRSLKDITADIEQLISQSIIETGGRTCQL